MPQTLAKEHMGDVMAQCYSSMPDYAQIVHPDRFSLPFSPSIHAEIFRLLEDDTQQHVAIAAPRGVGKTSLVDLALPARRILFRDSKFIVMVGRSATGIIEQTENLKRELVSNPIIKDLFGDMRSDVWSRDRWITSTGTMVLPRGAGQQIRGLLFNNDRPDLIIVDDLEDTEEVRSEENRK